MADVREPIQDPERALRDLARHFVREVKTASGVAVDIDDVAFVIEQSRVGDTLGLRPVACIVVEGTLYVSVEYLGASPDIQKAVNCHPHPHGRVEVLFPPNWRPNNRASRRARRSGSNIRLQLTRTAA